MQQPSWKRVKVGILLGTLGLVLGLIGCSSASESGYYSYAAFGEGSHPPPDLGLLDTQGLYDAGAEGTLSYDFTTHAFTGTVENTTKATLRRVRG